MAVAGSQVPVNAAAPVLVATGPGHVLLRSSNTCYLGDSSVTTSTGFEFTGQGLGTDFELGANEALYAIGLPNTSVTVFVLFSQAK